MALKDKIRTDRHTVFMRLDHFAEDTHTWNGKPIPNCIVADDEALKRKNNNVVDVSWDNTTVDKLIYVPVEDWPDRYPVPNDTGYFDRVYMRILQVQNDGGMLAILLATNQPRAVAR